MHVALRCRDEPSLQHHTRSSGQFVPFILPFRATWSLAGLGGILEREYKKLCVGVFHEHLARPRFVWRLGGRHLQRVFASYSDEYSSDVEDFSIFNNLDGSRGW